MRKICFYFSFVLMTLFLGTSVFAEEIHVCVGSYAQKENADKLLSRLEDFEVSAFINKVEKDGGELYRVLLSPSFDSKEKAKKYREQVLTYPFVHHLKLKGLWICGGEKINKTGESDKKETSGEKNVPEVSPSVVVPENAIVLKKNLQQEIPLSEEKPYSVLVRSYKEEQNAENDKKRLEDNKIDSYILKTYDDDTYFSFDLHSGAFETEEEAQPLKEQLAEIGIKDTEISDFEDIKEKIQNYDEVVKSEVVVYEDGNTELPDVFSDSVKKVIREFPVNKNFQIEKIEIFDFDNMRVANRDMPDLKKFCDYIGDSSKIHAVSLAQYKDDLFGKNVVVLLSCGDDDAFDELPEEKKDNLKFKVTNGILDCIVLSDENGFVLYGINEKKNLAAVMAAQDFTQSEFVDFLNNIASDSSLLAYPQLRKTLFVLPDNSFVQRDFLKFELSKVDEDYAEQKDHAKWALPIVGHWRSRASLLQDEKEVDVVFFDLDYDYNAKRIHNMFMEDHVVNDSSHSSGVKNVDSWYVETWGNKEVSFSTKSYIIAVDSLFSMAEDELVELADDLKIWNEDSEPAK